MARASFGGGVADFVVTAAAPGDPLRFASATLTFWDAETGGTQHTDLILGAAPVTSIPVGTNGQVPTFQGPDGVYVMWASAGGGERVQMVAAGDIVTRADAAVVLAEGSAADANAAKEAAEAVGDTNDAIMASRQADPDSAFVAAQVEAMQDPTHPVAIQQAASIADATVPRWKTGLAITTGQYVIEPNGGAIMEATANHTAGASFDVSKFKPAPGMPVNVRSYGCKGDWDKDAGTGTDDSTAWRAACDAAYTHGRAIYVPASDPGKYYAVSFWLMKGNHTIIGDGPSRSRVIKHPTVSSSTIMVDVGTSNPSVTFEGFSIDGAGIASAPNLIGTKGITGKVTIRRMAFTDFKGQAIQAAAPWVLVDDCDFDGKGAIQGQAISVQSGAREVFIKNVRGRYLKLGIVAGATTSKKVRYLSVSDSHFDGGWWTSIQKKSGSGAGVTYTATTITDTGATFTDGTIAAGDIIRVMTPLRAATITGGDGYALTMQDSGADFVTLGVLRGDIIRTADRMTVVRSVISATELLIEDWQSETDRSYTGLPSTGTSYTIYHVDRAAISAINSATQVTTYGNGFRTYNSAGVTPAAGTRYEILTVGSYQCIAALNAVERTDYSNVTVRKSASDAIVVQNGDATVTRCYAEDGRDNGLIMGSSSAPRGGKLIHAFNRAFHCGTGGHSIGWDSADCMIIGNIAEDCVSFSTGGDLASNQGSFLIGLTTGGIVANNIAIAGAGTRAGAPSYRLGPVSDGPYLTGNRGHGHTTGIVIPSGAANVRLAPGQAALVESVSDSGTGSIIPIDTGTPPQVDILSGAGNWSKPSGAVRHRVIAIGAGGGGGGGRRGAAATVRCGGGGGAAGAIITAEFLSSDLSGTEAYSCGSAGTAGAAATSDDSNGGAGGSGGLTFFGGISSSAKLFARGGAGGAGGTNSSGSGGSAQTPGTASGAAASSSGGQGGAASNATGRPHNGSGAGGGGGGGITSGNADSAGGTGAAALSGSSTDPAGGGAGVAGTAGSAPTNPALSGGSGGGGGGSSTGAGGAGGAGSYGSGGGGGGASLNGNNSGAGGAGGAGRIIVISYFN